MKFEIDVEWEQGTRVTSVVGEFDGAPPVPHLEVGLDLHGQLNGDRLAVGLALIYSPWLAGPMHTPEPVSSLTAQRINEFFRERFVTVSTVTDTSRSIPRGTQQVVVHDMVTDRTSTPATNPTITLAPFALREGAVSGGFRHTVASNIHVLSSCWASNLGSSLNTLGLSVILADYADANVLVHRAAEDCHPTLIALLESVGLGLAAL